VISVGLFPLLTSLPLTKIGITYDANLRGKDLSTETQIAVIGSIEPEITLCMKMPTNCRENLRAKFPPTTLGYSVVRIFHLSDVFSQILKLEASPEGGQQLQQKDKKRRKRKGDTNNFKKTEQPKRVGHFLVQKLKMFSSAHTPAKNVFLSRLGLIWFISWLKMSKNVQEKHLYQKLHAYGLNLYKSKQLSNTC